MALSGRSFARSFGEPFGMVSEQQATRLRSLRSQGLSIGTIARREGLSKSTVHGYVKDVGQEDPDVHDLPDALEQLLSVLSIICGNCEKGRFGMVLFCSGCGQRIHVSWRPDRSQKGVGGEMILVPLGDSPRV